MHESKNEETMYLPGVELFSSKSMEIWKFHTSQLSRKFNCHEVQTACGGYEEDWA